MDGDGVAPEAPQGVRVRIGADWEPVDVIYVGVDQRGMHEWAALVVTDGDEFVVDDIAADVMPAMTTLAIRFEPRQAS
jgi:hypothetical protein